jgi:hypothetical protein
MPSAAVAGTSWDAEPLAEGDHDVGIDYRRPGPDQLPGQPPAQPPAQPPTQPPNAAGQPTVAGPRSDIAAALASVPPNIRTHLHGEAAAALDLLSRHLSPDEPVGLITSVAARQGGPHNSVLAVTGHRLIFVAPAPQAVGWRLSSLTKIQLYAGYFFLNGDAGDYSLGLADDAWGAAVEQHVKTASTIAILAGR